MSRRNTEDTEARTSRRGVRRMVRAMRRRDRIRALEARAGVKRLSARQQATLEALRAEEQADAGIEAAARRVEPRTLRARTDAFREALTGPDGEGTS